VPNSNYVGGLVGLVNGGEVRDSYATGSVTGKFYVGGLVGALDGSSLDHVNKSYASGLVTATNFQGGLVGRSSPVTGGVNNSFWDTTTSGQSSSDGGDARTSTGMKVASTFTGAGWSSSTWDLQDGRYPTLKGLANQCGFDRCWDGGAGTFNWLDASNWTGNALPGSTQSIYIGSLASPVLFSGSEHRLHLLQPDQRRQPELQRRHLCGHLHRPGELRRWHHLAACRQGPWKLSGTGSSLAAVLVNGTNGVLDLAGKSLVVGSLTGVDATAKVTNRIVSTDATLTVREMAPTPASPVCWRTSDSQPDQGGHREPHPVGGEHVHRHHQPECRDPDRGFVRCARLHQHHPVWWRDAAVLGGQCD
jgi:hypothetical protein